METIAWLGFSQGLFAAILMMTKKERGVADKLLTAWLSLLSIEFLTCGIDYTVFGYPLLSSSFLLFNPAFYLYVKSLVSNSFKLRWVQLLNLLPFILFESIIYIIHEPYKLNGFLIYDSTLWFRIAFSIASVISWIVYNYATSVILFRHRRKLVDQFSNIDSYKSVGWLIFVVVFYNTFCFFLVLTGILSVFIDFDYPLSPVYNYSALLAMVYILGFYGLKQQVIYKQDEKPDEKSEKNDDRYINSQLTESKKAKIKVQLINYFEKQKPYFNPDLNMDMLSESLKIPKHQITEVLNMDIGKNFFLFVNEYRVNAVKEKLKDSKNLFSIEAIGYDCGFNSKSSFFTVFKKITGKTPLQYKTDSNT